MKHFMNPERMRNLLTYLSCRTVCGGFTFNHILGCALVFGKGRWHIHFISLERRTVGDRGGHVHFNMSTCAAPEAVN